MNITQLTIDIIIIIIYKLSLLSKWNALRSHTPVKLTILCHYTSSPEHQPAENKVGSWEYATSDLEWNTA